MNSSRRIWLLPLAVLLIGGLAAMNSLIILRNPEVGLASGLSGIAVCVLFLAWYWGTGRWETAEFGPSHGTAITPLLFLLGVMLLCDAVSFGLGYSEAVLISWAVIAIILIAGTVLYLLYLLATTWTRRRTTHRIVIGQMATVVRQNLPLATGLSLAADSERGAARRNLRNISTLLAQGLTLSEAISRGFPDCPTLPLSLIEAGEKSGQLAEALDQSEQYLMDTAQRRERVDVSVWPFLVIVIAFMLTVLAGIMVAVIPKYKEIFKDFGTQLPALTLFVINVCEFMVNSGLLAILSILALIALPTAIYLGLRPRRWPELRWTSRVADWIRWNTPGWGDVEFSSGMTVVLRTIRLAVRSGMGLEPAARLAAQIDVNAQLRPRVTRFADLLARGANVRVAAEQAELGEVTAVALAAGQRSADLDASLRYAADYNEALTNRFWIVMRNLAWPVGTLLLGCLVGTVVVALFQPLVALINSVCGVWG